MPQYLVGIPSVCSLMSTLFTRTGGIFLLVLEPLTSYGGGRGSLSETCGQESFWVLYSPDCFFALSNMVEHERVEKREREHVRE